MEFTLDHRQQDMPFRLEPLREDHFAGLHDLFDSVCREKKFLVFTQAGPREGTYAHYRRILSSGETHFVAIRKDRIIGWCDVIAHQTEVRGHVGTLGMAVALPERGQGVGRALIEAAIAHATERSIKRIELTVHAENLVAQSLYRSVGFSFEGTQHRSWCIDGRFFDVHSMARLSED